MGMVLEQTVGRRTSFKMTETLTPLDLLLIQIGIYIGSSVIQMVRDHLLISVNSSIGAISKVDLKEWVSTMVRKLVQIY